MIRFFFSDLGILLRWLKMPAWNVGDRGHEPLSGIQLSKKQIVFSPLTGKDLIFVVNLRVREVACLASDRQGSYFEFCVWRAGSSHSSHHHREIPVTQYWTNTCCFHITILLQTTQSQIGSATDEDISTYSFCIFLGNMSQTNCLRNGTDN